MKFENFKNTVKKVSNWYVQMDLSVHTPKIKRNVYERAQELLKEAQKVNGSYLPTDFAKLQKMLINDSLDSLDREAVVAIQNEIYMKIMRDYIDAICSKFLENKEHKQGIRQYGVISQICHVLLENMILFKNNKTLEFWKYETCGSGRYTHYREVNSVQCYTDKFEVIENSVKYKKDQKYILKIDMRRSFFKKLEKELKAFINED